ncbi:proline racemase family protein [Gemmata sp.]|uniref:4-hydroxyproline epimerase n=1 Tax=Gemmata sp. TaxID=1914242 RepID=UPI003F6E8E25
MHRTTVIDSHTGGEPTRVVVSGGPDLGTGPLADRARRFGAEFDGFRSRVVNEPRGSDVLVGALLCEPSDPACAAGVIFFNNVGVLGMCGHGTIGLAVTLAHLGKIAPGEYRVETPVGVVTAELHDAHRVTVRNVPSYRYRRAVALDVPGVGPVVGDIAWGGNWFFLVANYPEALTVANAERLTDVSWRIRRALEAARVTGANGGVIDHIELFGPPLDAANHGRNFVLCPGKAYDRSPCGTGTSAKLACLFADGKLRPGDVWRQESVTGSVFEGTVAPTGDPGVVVPSITGTAFVTAEATLLADPADPLKDGIRI